MNVPESPEIFETLISSRVAANLVGVHYKTMERLARTRQIPATKIGRSWIFKKSALNRWLDELLTSNLEHPRKAIPRVRPIGEVNNLGRHLRGQAKQIGGPGAFRHDL